MDAATAMDKLRVLLPHWIEHNRQHATEFGKWAAAARTEGAEPLAALLDRAAAALASADKILREARSEAGELDGGGEAPPPHAHRHDHGKGPAS